MVCPKHCSNMASICPAAPTDPAARRPLGFCSRAAAGSPGKCRLAYLEILAARRPWRRSQDIIVPAVTHPPLYKLPRSGGRGRGDGLGAPEEYANRAHRGFPHPPNIVAPCHRHRHDQPQRQARPAVRREMAPEPQDDVLEGNVSQINEERCGRDGIDGLHQHARNQRRDLIEPDECQRRHHDVAVDTPAGKPVPTQPAADVITDQVQAQERAGEQEPLAPRGAVRRAPSQRQQPQIRLRHGGPDVGPVEE